MTCSKCSNPAPALVDGQCWSCRFPRPEHDNPAHWAAARPDFEAEEKEGSK